MATPPGDPVRSLINLVHSEFQQVRVVRHDATPVRTVVVIECQYGPYAVRISEVVGASWRHYSYYVLDDSTLVVGFDNTADRPAIRLKYGQDWHSHIHEPVPHRHGPARGELTLTDEMTCEAFIVWLKAHLSLDSGAQL